MLCGCGSSEKVISGEVNSSSTDSTEATESDATVQEESKTKEAASSEVTTPSAAESVEGSADAVAAEISASIENLVGTTEDTAPKAAPQHPVNDTTTSKFANLQFGKNYDPTGH